MASRSPGDVLPGTEKDPKRLSTTPLLRRAVQGFEAAVESLVFMCGGPMSDKRDVFFHRGLKTCIILSVLDCTKLLSVDEVS